MRFRELWDDFDSLYFFHDSLLWKGESMTKYFQSSIRDKINHVASLRAKRVF
jgi:hypothetical protein